MVGNPYSSMKVLKHLDRIKCAMHGTMKPVFLQIDFTNKCNFSCLHCSSQMYKDYTQHNMASHNKERIVDLLKEAKDIGVMAIEATGGGEPTLHPSFVEVMKEIRKNFEFALVTNGSMLNRPDILDSIIGASWVRISVDAANKCVHKEVHGIGIDYFFTICSAAEKIKKESPDTVIGFSFVITDRNFHQIIDAARIARNSGFDNIRFTSYYSPRGSMIKKEIRERIYELLQVTKLEIETENFKVFTFSERVEKVYEKKKEIMFCYYASLVGIISATGKVFPCCAMKNMPEHCMGDIYEDSLSDIYADRKMIVTDKCPPCWMGAKNDLVRYVLEPQLHSNFP